MKNAVKSEWQVRPLGEVVTLNYGKALARSERDPNGSIPVYGANGVMDWSEHTLAEGPSLIVGRKGSAGEVTRVDGPFWPSDVTYYTTHDHTALDFDFLHYTLLTLNLPSMARGVKPGINRNDVYALPIPLPPLEEQQRIVAILDEAFEGLARARAHAEVNLENTNELFRNTLAQRTNSEDFSRVLLSEICDVRDGTHDTPKYVDEGVPLVTQKNIRPEGLSLENVKLISQDDHTAIHRRSNVAEGDILISMIGVNRGMSCLVDRDDVFSIKNVGLIKETTELNMNFLLYYLKSADAEKYIEEATNGGAQPFVGLGKLRAFPIPFPERAVQDRVAAELTEMRGAVQALAVNYEAQIKDFDDLRQSLLQKAFAGELT
nr:restriction endonuclease subunit S [uncultured Cohaesibacter sp.]